MKDVNKIADTMANESVIRHLLETLVSFEAVVGKGIPIIEENKKSNKSPSLKKLKDDFVRLLLHKRRPFIQ